VLEAPPALGLPPLAFPLLPPALLVALFESSEQAITRPRAELTTAIPRIRLVIR
jgi:hypothetical protein